MICQVCGKRNATKHIHSVVNGVVKDKYLCSECASKYHSAGFGENDIFKILSAFMNDGITTEKNIVSCDCCGATLAEISKTGKVGCGNCYKVFGKELAPTLVRLHGRTTHIGKKPGDAAETGQVENKAQDTKESIIEKMSRELKEAVKKEEYEKAAVLRDKIRKAKEEE